MSDYHEQSECNRYTVAAYRVMGQWQFIAWRLSASERKAPTELGTYKTAAGARRRCEREGEAVSAAA